MCFGSKGNKTIYKDAEPLGPKNDPDGGFTQRNNEIYRKQLAAEQDPSAVQNGLGGMGGGQRKRRQTAQSVELG